MYDFTPGTRVAVGAAEGTRIGTAERATKTQIIVRFPNSPADNLPRFRKDDLRRIGADTWVQDAHLRLATEEDFAEVHWRGVRNFASRLDQEARERDRVDALVLLKAYADKALRALGAEESV